MAILTPQIVDANSPTAVTDDLSLTTETIVTLSTFHETGNKDNYRVVLQQSPIEAGGKWREVGKIINGVGSVTTVVSAQRVRGRVHSVEGTASSVEIHIVAK